MITKWFGVITVSIMLAAFFCVRVSAANLPKPPATAVEESPTIAVANDKNYLYIGRYNGLDYFLDIYSIEVKKNKGSARSWKQFIFPIGEKLPSNIARSTLQVFFTDGVTAYNSSHRRDPIDEIDNEIERDFLMKCFRIGYETAFNEKF